MPRPRVCAGWGRVGPRGQSGFGRCVGCAGSGARGGGRVDAPRIGEKYVTRAGPPVAAAVTRRCPRADTI